MSIEQRKSSHRNLFIVIAVAALVIVLSVLSAFVWPGWALNKNVTVHTKQDTASSSSLGPTKPTIKAKALPTGASTLLSAMPDSVLNFARTQAQTSSTWSQSSPLEEYNLKYETGIKGESVSLELAQWSVADDAKNKYDSLVGGLTGDTLATGNVKVKGNTTGSYIIKLDANDSSQAIAVWQNDTVVFYATGLKKSILRFYQKFPL